MAQLEATTSRQSKLLSLGRKSHEQLSRMSTPVPHAGPSSAVSPTAPAEPVKRIVRTVPPSAAFEPPSPPTPFTELSQDQAFGSTTAQVSPLGIAPAAANVNTAPRKRRRAPRVKYDTSDSSDDEEGESDEEPPWWTFTQRGMAKMRARIIQENRGRSGRDTEGVSGAESGWETNRESQSRSKFRRGSKQSNKSNRSRKGRERERERERDTATPTSSRNGSRANSREGTPRLRPPNNDSKPSLLWRRSVGRDIQQPPIVLGAPAMTRSTSAPSAAELHLPLPPPVLRLPSNASSASILNRPTRSSSGSKPIPSPRKTLTGPNFPLFRKRDSDAQTDTDASTAPTPRPKPKKPPSRSSTQETPGEEDVPTQAEGVATSSGPPKPRRKQTNRLKLQLPPSLASGWPHMPHGWPQAGTWQDAYHGHYGMPAPPIVAEPIDLTDDAMAPPPPKPRRRSKQKEKYTTPDLSEQSVPPSPNNRPSSVQSGPTRRKSRKNKRYRQALVPPTPVGLGFTPAGARRQGEEWKEGRVGASNDFDWSNKNGTANGDTTNGNRSHNAIEEGDELARTETRVTNEKSDTAPSEKKKKKKRWFGLGIAPVDTSAAKRGKDLSLGEKWRRMLFLDARVTIYIRLFNLAVVICSLVIAVLIRQDLRKLDVPGLMGSSTVLLIAFSAFTMVHVITAIYREYFGKPIGLWGLRSKMLWVCLDLAFIALWSSTLSLAINDYIATALDCTVDTPWWREGLSEAYRELLESLEIPSGARTGAAHHVTSVHSITATLGVTLPSEVTSSKTAEGICDKQVGSIALALITLILYTGNMVLSLFRIFETVRRTANVSRAVMV